MPKHPNFFRRDYDIIKAHNDRLIVGVKRDIDRIRQTPRSKRNEIDNGMIDYWIHAVQALKWSTAIAAQRAGVPVNG
jgi:hypothetical protein